MGNLRVNGAQTINGGVYEGVRVNGKLEVLGNASIKNNIKYN